ncbi:hypothetical protein GOP47_0027632, partial [Adiantum capillus-veneris]
MFGCFRRFQLNIMCFYGVEQRGQGNALNRFKQLLNLPKMIDSLNADEDVCAGIRALPLLQMQLLTGSHSPKDIQLFQMKRSRQVAFDLYGKRLLHKLIEMAYIEYAFMPQTLPYMLQCCMCIKIRF